MLHIFNEKILFFFRSFDINNFTHIFFNIFADAPIFFIPIFLVGFWFYYNYKKDNNSKENLLFIFYNSFIVVLVNYFIKALNDIQRPMYFYNIDWATDDLVLHKIPESSFPSDHAGISVWFLVSLYLFGYKKTFFTVLPFFIIMNISRMTLMLHWPFDILVWSFIWLFAGFFIYKNANITILKKINTFVLKVASYIKL